MEIAGAPGEKLTGFSPTVPNPEYFPHVRLTLQLIGVNVGLPLVMVLMDASDTNFSGWRGAVDQARLGFVRNQRWLRDKLHRRVYRWKLLEWAAQDRALAAAFGRLGPAYFTATWNTPRWPYIQPLQDAQADELRVKSRLTSPRRMQAERGQDYDDITAELVADNAGLWRAAIAAAADIERETGIAIDPRQLVAVDPDRPLLAESAASVASEAIAPAAEPMAMPDMAGGDGMGDGQDQGDAPPESDKGMPPSEEP
jgi:capsid protein